MKVLILGSGGREHALAWKISQSKLLTELYCAPGNPGTSSLAKNIPLDIKDFKSIAEFIIEAKIEPCSCRPRRSFGEWIERLSWIYS